MKILKTGLILSALSIFLLSCKTSAQSSTIQSVTYSETFGRGGATSVTATKDSLETSARGGKMSEFPSFKKKMSPKDWQKLISGLDISLLEATKSGERRGLYDGSDEIFRIKTSEKEYEFYNVPAESAGYKQLEQLKKALNNLVSQNKQ